MPTRSSIDREDEEGLAGSVVEAAEKGVAPSTADGKNAAAVILGRLGGKKGGLARAKKLTKEQRSAIAKKAAVARWAQRAKETE